MSQSVHQCLGVCSWSLGPQSPADLVTQVQATGLRRLQLHLTPLIEKPGLWGNTFDQLGIAGIETISGMFGCHGENYASLEAIRLTGGLVPDDQWERNLDRAGAVAQLAGQSAIGQVSFHAGFIPKESADPRFAKLVDRVDRVAGLFEEHGIELLMETGQETAATLLTFLEATRRPNLGVNFDPANMILYGMGDPVAALQTLIPHVRQVHIKDAKRAARAGEWGREVAVGQGEVDWHELAKTLRRGDYSGNLVIEREGGASRVQDVRQAAEVVVQSISSAS